MCLEHKVTFAESFERLDRSMLNILKGIKIFSLQAMLKKILVVSD
jgi:hypothetical protein